MLGPEPFYFHNTVHNFGTVSTTPGTAITTTTTANTDGTAVTLLSALAFDVHYVTIAFGGTATAAASNSALLDILVDPAGGTSWTAFINDLAVGNRGVLGVAGTLKDPNAFFHFPVFIKAGTSIGARIRWPQAAALAGRVLIQCYGDPSQPDQWWCGTGVETLGAVPASSSSTAVALGTSSALGSWVTIGTSSYRYGAVQPGIHFTGGTLTAFGSYMYLGVGSTVLPGAPTYYITTNTSEQLSVAAPAGPIWCDVPASTIWQMAGRSSSASATSLYGSIYGVY